MLLALDNDATAKRKEELAAQGQTFPAEESEGLSPEDILSYFYETDVFERAGDGWTAPFDPASLKPGKAMMDVRDAESGEVVVKEGSRITPRVLSKLAEQGVKRRLATTEELVGKFLARDIVNMST
jgi:DNA-directed RNA polymerase subunit beta